MCSFFVDCTSQELTGINVLRYKYRIGDSDAIDINI